MLAGPIEYQVEGVAVTDDKRQEEAHRFWREGTKYVVEGARSLVLINGVAAGGILTFIGNHHTKSYQVIRAINILAAGAMMGAMVFIFAYYAQLQYGNRALGTPGAHCRAVFFQWCALVTALLSIGCFAWGLYTAGNGL